jgi:flagellar hook-associated protein 3 FlgL
MNRITAMTMTRNVLADINAANARVTKSQEQLSSGKVLNKPSDDPSAVARAMQLHADLQATEQYQQNASEAVGWASVTDSALGSVAEALQRVRELAVQGANGSAGPESHTAIAEEITQLVDTIKTAGNASYGGRFVFSGTATDTRPFAMGASDVYNGDGETVMRQIGPNVAVGVNITGRRAIGDDTAGLLKTVRDVLGYAQSGNAQGMSNSLNVIDVRMDELNAVRAQVGATQNRIEVATARLAEYEGTALDLLNKTESADIAKTMMEYNVHQAAYQAGLKAGANIVQASLLDFLR